MASVKYRPEIDGLRAVAVIPVILFHAGIELFGGGFVGVDVFFVISGYLIARIIIEELHGGRFSLRQFYWRRARRILPALFFVTICCIPFAWKWMLPSEFEDFSKSLVAVNLFSSNFLFWQQSGYFAAAAGEKPLLHTWSLAVEEQYYMLFPLFLLCMWRFGKTAIVWAILIAAAVSLGLSEWAWRNAPAANFYLAPTRVWELFAGAICSFIHFKNKPKTNNILSSFGLFLILFSIFYYDKSTPFPSVYALAPILGTALIILFAGNKTLVSRMLSAKAVVGLGLISYSTYLWHHPLFAFARIRNIYEPNVFVMLFLSAASIALGYLTWRFIEFPVRRTSKKAATSAAFISISAGVILFGVFGNYKLSKQIPFPDNIEWESLGQRIAQTGHVCDVSDSKTYPGLQLCYFGDLESNDVFALYGDSHAEAISHELQKEFVKRKIKGARIKAAGCEEIPKLAMSEYGQKFSSLDPETITSGCLPAFNALLRFVQDSVSDVIVVSRWSFRLYPIKGHIENFFFDNGEGGKEPDQGYKEFAALDVDNTFKMDALLKRAALEHLIQSFAATKKRIFLVYPIPEMGWNIVKENSAAFRRTGNILDRLSISKQVYDMRNGFVLDVFDTFSDENVTKIRTDEIFCNSFMVARCAGQIDGIPLYYDDDHLSDAGARLIVDNIFQHLATPHTSGMTN